MTFESYKGRPLVAAAAIFLVASVVACSGQLGDVAGEQGADVVSSEASDPEAVSREPVAEAPTDELVEKAVASEAYRVQKPCTFSPPPPAIPTKINFAVTPLNSPPSPLTKIVARKGSGSSFEREVVPRFADIFMTAGQFSFLLNNCNTATVSISYSADAVAGDDPITGVAVTVQ